MPTLVIPSSPVGPLWLRADEVGICAIGFGKLERADPGESAHLERTRAELERYFRGSTEPFTVPLSLSGTEFQLRVWAELQKIRWGERVSYGEIARRLGQPGAMRAVGLANGRNPVPIVVPCHRVIAAEGKLGGYSGGLHIKKALLRLEQPTVLELG